MKLLRIVDKETLVFIRDDFSFDEETELGLDTEPSSGLYKPKAVSETKLINGIETVIWHWVEGGQAPIDTRTFSEKLISLIRAKYSIDDEIALTNKGIADSTNAEYLAYRAYVAQCKEALR